MIIKEREIGEEFHHCHFCGTLVKAGYESNGARHYLSDCRPDLVAHEIGEICTWDYDTNRPNNRRCYAYQNRDTMQWENEHIHFYSDGPM